ncbi:MAG: CoA transferase, partial [Novosphingobium sp.]
IDLSALWAGPLCSHLLQLAGAQVVKVESRSRPDALRGADPAFFALLNGGKDSVSVDLADNAVHALIAKADIVIEAARPRALAQLGIDANALVAAKRGKVWITLTGHGALGHAADWIGFGDDCGVAGGLSAALREASGTIGFVGDAISDPLTGIASAGAAWQAWSSGNGGRIGLSMSGVAAQALADERAFDAEMLREELAAWGAASLRSFAPVALRAPMGSVHPLGADSARWLSC